MAVVWEWLPTLSQHFTQLSSLSSEEQTTESIFSKTAFSSGQPLSPAKMAEATEMPFGFKTQVVPRNDVLDEGPDLPMGIQGHPL